ncbi:MAG TPA: metal-dependent hydrolase [Methylotenera sp.]|nr:metal-dependent hydrolase [Methylotenera sp.]HPN01963.1 metal-dependent hydrolase [Methylotenera sp.]
MTIQTDVQIIPRTGLDFSLSNEIPTFWFGGDAFKTRLFDAHSLLTPAGEGFFIRCLKAYKNQIRDSRLNLEVEKFILQEGQHTLQHRLSNNRLKAQGIDVDKLESDQQKETERFRLRISQHLGLALTTAYEHITTITSHALMEHPELFSDADPNIFSLYAWHSAEEIEHKSVCFDVMQNVAKVKYPLRVFALVIATLSFQVQVSMLTGKLLRHDGFSFTQRLALWRRGLKWMYGKNGFTRIQLKHYFAYFRPHFHPTSFGDMSGYNRWKKIYRLTNDPLIAGKMIQKNDFA